MSRRAPLVYTEFRTHAPHKSSSVILCGKHPGQRKQVARLHRLDIGDEWFGGRWDIDAKFFQPRLGACRPGV